MKRVRMSDGERCDTAVDGCEVKVRVVRGERGRWDAQRMSKESDGDMVVRMRME